MAGRDKRADKRVPVVLRIKLHYPNVETFVSKFATNISQGGMFIGSRTPKPVGTEVRFELRLADNSTVISGDGLVRWVREFDPDKPRRPHGMGIEFGELSEESARVIERIVEHKRKLGADELEAIPHEETRTEPAAVAPPEADPEAEPAPASGHGDGGGGGGGGGNGTIFSEERLLAMIDGDVPVLSAALQRARTLIDDELDPELAALLGEGDAAERGASAPLFPHADDTEKSAAFAVGPGMSALLPMPPARDDVDDEPTTLEYYGGEPARSLAAHDEFGEEQATRAEPAPDQLAEVPLGLEASGATPAAHVPPVRVPSALPGFDLDLSDVEPAARPQRAPSIDAALAALEGEEQTSRRRAYTESVDVQIEDDSTPSANAAHGEPALHATTGDAGETGDPESDPPDGDADGGGDPPRRKGLLGRLFRKP